MSTTTLNSSSARGAGMTKDEKFVIFASSTGTVFEWYDFYLYAVLAPFFAALFFPPGNDTAALLSAFATYAAGFLVRPFGALLFGRIGDLVGRKYTFLVTIMVMGASTFAVGLLPTFAAIGWLAPILLVTLRLLQGLALGGEYGGAATYVAEHSPPGRARLCDELDPDHGDARPVHGAAVIALCRTNMDAEGVRRMGLAHSVPGLGLLLIFSVCIRLKLNETPIFQKMKEEGKGSKSPLTDSFLRYPNNKYVLLALLGATAGQGVVWYTGQFYALFFLTITLKLDYLTAYILIGISLLIGTPFFIFFGWLSDRIGRLKIILAGCLIARHLLPAVRRADQRCQSGSRGFQAKQPITVTADPATCNFHIFVGPWSKFTDCDRAKDLVTKLGLSFTTENGAGGLGPDRSRSASTTVNGFNAGQWNEAFLTAGYPNLQKNAAGAIVPKPADTGKINWFLTELILFIMVIYVTMVYGPIAAFLVELFPTSIRYTSMSLPYHIGNGWFGGMLPLLATAIVAATGNIYNGLWYPIIVAAMTLVIGAIFLRDTKDIDLTTGSGVETMSNK